MDIVKRAYLKTLEEYKAEPGWPDVSDFEENVRREIIRLIKVRAYSGRDWPRELGTLPDELRSESMAKEQLMSTVMKCEMCKHWKVLNLHHIEDGKLVKNCDYGEHPDSCREYKEVKKNSS